MDLHLDIEAETAEYLEESGVKEKLTEFLTEALTIVGEARNCDPLAFILDTMSSLEGNRIIVEGCPVTVDPDVELTVGPVVGEVTDDRALVMVEVKSRSRQKCEITSNLFRKGGSEPVEFITKECSFATPQSFEFTNLEPNTEYVCVFNGLDRPSANRAFGLFKTKPLPENMRAFKIIALSCDRPDRQLLGQKNPWYDLAKKSYTADCMLHLGDQVYNKGEDNDNSIQLFESSTYEDLSPSQQKLMKKRAKAILRNKYRDTWNKKMTRTTLQRGSHLMIWSDNDVANDFTTLKDQNGEQAYPAAFLQCGIEVYRQYQRILWDPDHESKLPDDPSQYFSEFHSHIYGPVGIFLIDMRGNRITADGVQQSENPLVSEEQWEAIEQFFSNPDLKVIIMCSEIPFVGDEPDTIKEKAEKVDFLKDHWPYNDTELVRLLDLAFNWKSEAEDEREVVFLGGDIHCGVTSVIRDEQTDLTITHLTTSPVTNHVCKFFPELHGRINDRYTFDHMPLGDNQRNYAEIYITLDPFLSVTSQLKAVSTNHFKVTKYMSDDEDEGEGEPDEE